MTSKFNGADLQVGAEEETTNHALCQCQALASLGHAYLRSFFLDPEDVDSRIWGQSGTLVKKQDSHDLVLDYGAKRAHF